MSYRYFAPLLLMAVSTAAQPALPADVPSLAPMLEKITPAVVNIATEGRIQLQSNPLYNDPMFRRFFNVPDQPVERKTQSLGSGVVVDAKRGLVLTNNHVIANAVQITVTLNDGRQLQAELVGTDPETDVAVIKVPPEDIVEIPTADSDALRVDFVVAIGNPFGLGQTVTSGIVSALSRSGLGIEGYEDFIQTDASINPGNSGGALVNLKGELVGINTAIFSQDGGNIGIGFAIPINLALRIAQQLDEKGEVSRGYIGVQVQDLSPDLAEAFGIRSTGGAVVNSVLPGSPAAEAGLMPGDVVTAVNGKAVKHAADLRNRIGLLELGTQVTFDVLREGRSRTLTAKVAAGGEPDDGVRAVNPRLEGTAIGDIDPEHPNFGRVQGVMVAEVEPGSPAWRAGLRPGDIISSVNHAGVKNIQEFLAAVDGKEGPLLLRVIRGRAAAFMVIK